MLVFPAVVLPLTLRLNMEMADRFQPGNCYLIFHIITVPMAFLMAVLADIPLVLVATVYFFFLLGMQPAENTLVARLTPKRLHHSAYGTKFILTFGVGALAVMMVSAIERRFDINAVFPALGALSILLVSSILLLLKQMKNGQ